MDKSQQFTSIVNGGLGNLSRHPIVFTLRPRDNRREAKEETNIGWAASERRFCVRRLLWLPRSLWAAASRCYSQGKRAWETPSGTPLPERNPSQGSLRLDLVFIWLNILRSKRSPLGPQGAATVTQTWKTIREVNCLGMWNTLFSVTNNSWEVSPVPDISLILFPYLLLGSSLTWLWLFLVCPGPPHAHSSSVDAA